MSKEKERQTLEPKDNPISEVDKEKLKQQELEALAAAKAVELRNRDKKLLEDKELDDKKEAKQKKVRGYLKIAIIVLIILLLLVRCSQLPLPENIRDIIDFGFEDTINPSNAPTSTPSDYDGRKALLTISMNKVVTFADGLAQGPVNILNDEQNVYWQFVEIYLDNAEGKPDESKLVYKSNLIDIGQLLQYDSLDINLPAGKYPATAYFNAVSPETREVIGKAGAKIDIIIKASKGDTVDVNSDFTAIVEGGEIDG